MDISVPTLVRWLIIAVAIGVIAFWARRRRAERNRKISEVLQRPTVDGQRDA